MDVRSRQQGVTMWGMFSIAALVVFFSLLLFKLIPPYLQDLKVKTALDSVEKQAEGGGMSILEIREALRKRFDIDDIEHVELSDITIEPRGRNKFVRIEYEAQIPLILNISALLEFDHSAEIPSFE